MNLEDIKGVGPQKIKLFNKLEIYNINDLINFYPFRYEILKKSDLNTLSVGDKIIIDGTIESNPTLFYFNRKMDKMNFKLNTGNKLFNVSIFNRGFLKNNLKIGSQVTIVGKLEKNGIIASDIKYGPLIKEKIIPIYHTTQGLNNKSILNLINMVLKMNFNIIDYIPTELVEKYNFISKMDAIKTVHNPNDIKYLNKSINRLKYEELFLFMMKINWLKKNRKKKDGLNRSVNYSEINNFISTLPFTLTIDQNKVVRQIYDDLVSGNRMNRLLQGDVGSGKTIVAIIAIYINFLSGYQSALMAPTEILAKQHYENVKKLFKNFNVNICLLTGKTKIKEKKQIYEKIGNGEINVVIGTHALFTNDLIYNNLGLVITDEQHRFGVNQRGNLRNKGLKPDILYMSATPIPRTYALTLYGDMDVSSIKTSPNGRKDIITEVKSSKEIKNVLENMYSELKKNHQIYVIAPLIEDNDNSTFENVEQLQVKMNKAFGKLYNIGVLHGKMTNEEKDIVMEEFSQNKINILISTTVIEVGIDVPNATMIVIFDAYRFGLSTLHQLRGRVGRNSLQSYCILISDKETERLNILSKTNDGFKISEEDFLLRGSGDLFGINQSGDMSFKIANLKKDYKILIKAKEDSLAYLNKYEFNNKYLENIDLS